MNNITSYSMSSGSVIGLINGFSGNMFQLKTVMPSYVPNVRYVSVCKPYGMVFNPHEFTSQFIVNNSVMGYYDNRLFNSFQLLQQGETCTHSDYYALFVQNSGLTAIRETDKESEFFKTYLASGDNAKTIIQPIFDYLVYLESKIEQLESLLNSHVHGNGNGGSPTTAPTEPFDVDFKGQSYSEMIKQSNNNKNGQIMIKDGTNILE